MRITSHIFLSLLLSLDFDMFIFCLQALLESKVIKQLRKECLKQQKTIQRLNEKIRRQSKKLADITENQRQCKTRHNKRGLQTDKDTLALDGGATLQIISDILK